MQRQDWAGDMGSKWHRYHAQFEAMIEPIGNAVIERAQLSPGESVVDIGCGTGPTTIEIARRVAPGGSVTGVDLAPVLIDAARARAAQAAVANVRFVCGDAARITLEAQGFDCLHSRFGVMFFDDPVAAFTHMHAWLRPGGRLAFCCWGPPPENPWVARLMEIVGQYVSLPPPEPRAPGPFQFAEPAFVTDVLSKAGFNAVEITPWRGTQWLGGPGMDAAGAASFAIDATFVGEALAESSEQVKAEVLRRITALLESCQTSEGVGMPAMAWLVAGHA
jgi:SAM-dependent methyltransferase